MEFKKNQDKLAQGAIEYLLIIGAAIIVVAIVIILITGIVSTPDTESGKTVISEGQLQLLLRAGSGEVYETQTINLATTGPTGYDIYYNSDLSNQIFTTKTTPITDSSDLKYAYEKGLFIVKLDGEKINNNYEFVDSIGNYNQIRIYYNNGTYFIQLGVNDGYAPNKLEIQYFNEPLTQKPTQGS